MEGRGNIADPSYFDTNIVQLVDMGGDAVYEMRVYEVKVEEFNDRA